jgi:hypothetical protein
MYPIPGGQNGTTFSRRRGGRWQRWQTSVSPLRGGYAVLWVPCHWPAGCTLLRSRTGEQLPGSTLMLTGRIRVEISGLVGARGGRIGLPDSLSGGVSRRAGRGDSHSEIRRTWFGARFEATSWMVGDLVTTEAPPLAGLAGSPSVAGAARSTGTLAYKLATTTDHKVIGIMYLVASSMRGMTAVDPSSCGRLAQVPDGSHSSVRPLHRMNRWGTWSWRCYQPTERSCSQVARDD